MTKIIITRKKRSSGGSSSGGRRKGIVTPRRQRQDLGRRRIQHGGIGLYDFGQFLDNSSVYVGIHDDNVMGPPPPIEGIYDDIRDAILATPNPFTAFKPLDKASAVAKELTISFGAASGEPSELSEYSGNTLAVSNEDLASLTIEGRGQFFGAFINFANPDGSSYKATLEPLFSADEVEFTPSVKMDIGLMPVPAHQDGSVNIDASGPDPALQQRLNLFAAVIPRAAAPILHAGEVLDYYLHHDYWRAMKLHPDARAYQGDGITVITIPPASFAPADKFPPPPATGPTGGGTSPSSVLSEGANDPRPSGALLAIIRKGSQNYYVWSM